MQVDWKPGSLMHDNRPRSFFRAETSRAPGLFDHAAFSGELGHIADGPFPWRNLARLNREVPELLDVVLAGRARDLVFDGAFLTSEVDGAGA